MKKTDLHENLCKYYEFMAGTIPNREVFVDSLRETVSSDELVIFFMIPFTGHIALDKLESRAEKKGITKDNLHKALSRMAREGIIRAYHSGAQAGRHPTAYLLRKADELRYRRRTGVRS
jgi:hypothetical protein